MELIYLIIGLLLGGISIWFAAKYKFLRAGGLAAKEAGELNEQMNSLNIQISKSDERNKLLEENLSRTAIELNSERAKVLELSSALSSLKSDYGSLQQKLSEQKSEIEELYKKFGSEFENLANKIFEEKSSKFTLQNKENLDQILKPLSEKIKDFEKKVEDVYVADSKERAGLIQQIKTLHDLNQQMSKDAANLTNALKGQSKTMGNWGEVILESVLEKSGLVKGREYFVQESMTDQSGRRLQPDVIVSLPENRSIVVDSKVSLIAYERYASAEDKDERDSALNEHIVSIKKHIKDLGAKNYQNLYQLQTLDFVLLFLPIEPAFNLAILNDSNLFDEAFEKNIVLVNPSTLLATLRTIASIWRLENQNKNALEIARQGGALYDKFVAFVDDLSTVGSRLDAAKDSYQSAMKKLHEGTGNLIRRAENIKKLGAKTSKTFPQQLLDKSDLDEEVEA